MAETLKTLVQERLTELHDSLTTGMQDHPPRDVLGQELDRLRSTGTGKSLVMLALLDDLLRMVEIATAPRWHSLSARMTGYLHPFLQSAIKTFLRKGLKQYTAFAELGPGHVGQFMQYHWESRRPFGGQYAGTQWSGLRICGNVAMQTAHPGVIDEYEHLCRLVLSEVSSRDDQTNTEEIRQLLDFLSDRCGDLRDRLAREGVSQAGSALAGERAELDELRKKLDSREMQVAERERIVQDAWEKFREERAEFEQLRQQWEEELATRDETHPEDEALKNERESLAIERAALNHQRMQLETAEKSRSLLDDEPANLVGTREELARERQAMERERAELWQEREELAALREQLLSENLLDEGDDSIFSDETSPESSEGSHAAVLGHEEANQELFEASDRGDVASIKAALGWGADINAFSAQHNWQCPLHLAVSHGHEDCVTALLENGASPEATDGTSLNPLETAIVHEQLATGRILLEQAPECVPAAQPMLLKVLRDFRSPRISQQLCLEALTRLPAGTKECFPPLLGLLESDSRSLCRTAVETLAHLDESEVRQSAIPQISGAIENAVTHNLPAERIAMLHAVNGDLHRVLAEWKDAITEYEHAQVTQSDEFQQELASLIANCQSQL